MSVLELLLYCADRALFSLADNVTKKLAVAYLCNKVYKVVACSYVIELKCYPLSKDVSNVREMECKKSLSCRRAWFLRNSPIKTLSKV